MQVVRTRGELDAAVRDLRAHGLALVPTMGALHDGHLALIEAARAQAGAVAASIFVNPLQFAPHEDLARYPRDEAGDIAKLRAAGCALLWLPSVETMYPPGDATSIEVGGPANGWEGSVRPGHFRGVATVVTKLFGQVRPDIALFGEKDWQQLQVIRRVTEDLGLPVRIVGVPVVRESDGLAMSSRNRFLSASERAAAPALYHALQRISAAVRAGDAVKHTLQQAERMLMQAGFAIDYLAMAAGETLTTLDAPAPGARLIAAARLGDVRLLDNIGLD
jgi:pantoate--beta-alanine ligase